MHELLRSLPCDALILDVGASVGSFDASECPGKVIRLDLAPPPGGQREPFVRADAAAVPFPMRTFDAVVCCHSLEHIEDLDRALSEIGRVVKEAGSLFISIPDASALTDRMFRWMAGPEGGHVNLFSSAQDLVARIEEKTGLRHAATRTICTSLSFLNRRNLKYPQPRLKSLLVLRGQESGLVLINAVFRLLDRFLGTRTCVYGWAMYFGTAVESVDTRPWINVCVRCGRGHPSKWLEAEGAVRHRWRIFPAYTCPDCGAGNYFTRDERYAFLAD